jgi:FolB domain-containing protein
MLKTTINQLPQTNHHQITPTQPTDTIYIRDLLVRGIIGIYDWEQKNKQDMLINAEIVVDISKAGQSDDIDDAVNYKSICKKMIQMAEENTSKLIEHLIERMATMILTEFPVYSVKLTIDKPGALRFSKSVGVQIERFNTLNG